MVWIYVNKGMLQISVGNHCLHDWMIILNHCVLCLIQDFFKSREAREFLSGALAGAMTKAVLAPLETIRSV